MIVGHRYSIASIEITRNSIKRMDAEMGPDKYGYE
jgi:hypothetical protein